MQIMIGDAKAHIPLPQRRVTLEEMVQHLEEQLFGMGNILSAIKLNGARLSYEDVQRRKGEVLAGDEIFECGVMPMEEYFSASLEKVSGATEELLKKLKYYAEQLHTQGDRISPKDLKNSLFSFYAYWIHLYQLLPGLFKNVSYQGKTFEETLHFIRGLVVETVEAIGLKEKVLLGDLLEFELIPAIHQLQAAIPDLRQVLSPAQRR